MGSFLCNDSRKQSFSGTEVYMLLEIYNKILNSRTFSDRAELGQSAFIIDAGDGWLIKSDRPGFDLVENEFEIMVNLQELGLDITPEVDCLQGSSFYLRKVNNGATLDEYVNAYLKGILPLKLLKALLLDVAKCFNTLWAAGYVHADPHLRNVVIGIERGGSAWKPYLIDFGFSFHVDNPPKTWQLQTIISTQEEDKERFLECLVNEACEDEALLEFISDLEDELMPSY